MEKNIRILIIDDSTSNTNVLVRRLTNEGYAPRFERVDIPSKLSQQLQHNTWDIIIAEHSIPRFSSMEAIKLIKAKDPDIPIIIISDSMNENEVVDTMRAGASDIILRGNMSRLIPVIERELRETQIRSEKRIAEERVLVLSQAIEQSRNLIFISDSSGVITYVNPSFCDITGYTAEEVYEQTAMLLNASNESVGSWNNKKICCSWHDQQLKVVFSRENWRGEIYVKRKTGEEFWVLGSISSIKNSNGDVVNLVNVGEDLSELKEKEVELAHLAFYDPVTGLANRRLLDDRLQQQLNMFQPYGRAKRLGDSKGKISALLCIDLDKFKKVNDTQGHGVGDILLKWVAEIIKSCIRDTDTAARTGGDEFHVLITELECEDVNIIAEKILTGLNKPFHHGKNHINVTASMGIVLIPRDGNDIKELKRKGDIALYYAKDNGRNNFQHYKDGMSLEKIEQKNTKAG